MSVQTCADCHSHYSIDLPREAARARLCDGCVASRYTRGTTTYPKNVNVLWVGTSTALVKHPGGYDGGGFGKSWISSWVDRFPLDGGQGGKREVWGCGKDCDGRITKSALASLIADEIVKERSDAGAHAAPDADKNRSARACGRVQQQCECIGCGVTFTATQGHDLRLYCGFQGCSARARRGRGRPPLEDKRKPRGGFNDVEWAKVKRAAAARGQTASAYLRYLCGL